ncbi:MAG: DUF6491 family protein [Litorimonas sp.]
MTLTSRSLPLVAVLGSAVLAACASTNDGVRAEAVAELLSDPRVGEQVDRVCFINGIDRFTRRTDYSVVLTEGVSDDYLVLVRSCNGLPFAQSLKLSGSNGCLRPTDRIQVFETAFGTGPRVGSNAFDFCQVEAVYRWDEKAATETDAAQ